MPRKSTSETKTVKTTKAKTSVAKPAHKPRAAKVAKPVVVFDSREHRAEIERRAFFNWLERGGAHGHAAEDWIRAEMEVRDRWVAQQQSL
jgi:hypothetical protein